MEFACCDLLLFRSGWEIAMALFWGNAQRISTQWTGSSKRLCGYFRFPQNEGTISIRNKRRYYCKVAQIEVGEDQIYLNVSSQSKLCWVIIRGRVSVLGLETCLVLLGMQRDSGVLPEWWKAMKGYEILEGLSQVTRCDLRMASSVFIAFLLLVN